MAEVFLICEGHADGVDVRVLDRILAQVIAPMARVQVIPAGGDKSLGGVRHYHEDRSRQPDKKGKLGRPRDKAFSIEDRNFRPRHEADASWSLPKNRSFIWRRHEIENYLLAPPVLLAGFDSLRRSQSWAAGLPSDENGVTELLTNLAHPLLDGHVGQLLRFELDILVRQTCSLSFPNPGGSTRGWGKLEWLSQLKQEALRLRHDCKAIVALPSLDPAAIDARYEAIRNRVCGPKFLQSGQYLEEMGGHELMSALLSHIHALGCKGMSKDDLEEELVNAITREYRPGIFVPDDFAELAARLQ